MALGILTTDIPNFILKIANDTNGCYNILICGDFKSRIGNEKDYVIFIDETGQALLILFLYY